MIEKEQTPIMAVTPTSEEMRFLISFLEETTEYARSRNLTDMYFQGHSDQSYFGAYSTRAIRRGAGLFIFGFERRKGKLRMAIPIGISEPYMLARPWTGDPSRNRAVIECSEPISFEMQVYLIEMGRRSITFHYEKQKSRYTHAQ